MIVVVVVGTVDVLVLDSIDVTVNVVVVGTVDVLVLDSIDVTVNVVVGECLLNRRATSNSID